MLRILVSACLMFTALVACSREPSAGEPPVVASVAAPATAAETTYSVRIVPGEAAAGAAATSVIEVRPSAGYKVNLDFPARLKLASPPSGVTAPKTDFAQADAEVTEQVLRFNVPFTAASSGKITLTGAADFSVCNETTCKLIRDEKLAWDVEVK